MEQSYLIEVVKRSCPFCNTVHNIEKRQRKSRLLIKNEPVQFDETYFFCPLCAADEENEFVPAEMMDRNLENARNAYRKVHGLLTSVEIAAVRAAYGISQSDLALLLGWGEVTVTRYESKSIQDETYDQILRLVRDDPDFTLRQLDKRKRLFSAEKYRQIRKSVLKQIEDVGLVRLNQKTIEAQYIDYEKPSDFNGYQTLDLKKLANIMSFFANYEQNLFKVKLMKLLWYVDALSFKRSGKAITGLVYVHKPYGALPLANSEIIYLPSLIVEETEINDTIGYHIMAKDGGSLKDFEPGEIDAVYQVAKEFEHVATQQIVQIMHAEDAYKNTDMNQIIPFSLCHTLKAFKN